MVEEDEKRGGGARYLEEEEEEGEGARYLLRQRSSILSPKAKKKKTEEVTSY